MNRLFKSLTLLALAAAIGIVIAAAASAPDYRVETSVTIHAPKEKIFALVGDLNRWPEWSPWKTLDSSVQFKPVEPPTKVGSRLEWTSAKGSSGGYEVTSVVANEHIAYRLFFQDWSSESQGRIELSSPSPRQTLVRWSLDGRNDFAGRIFWILFRLESSALHEFDQGLALLKQQCELPIPVPSQ